MIILFGGSFDPPHAGHCRLAEAASQIFPEATVVWMPAWCSPHKQPGQTRAADRRDLVAALIASRPQARWQLDEQELHAGAPVYTLDSVQRWRRDIGPDQPLALLLGEDSWANLWRWHRVLDLIAAVHLIVVPRPQPLPLLPAAQENWARHHQVLSPDLLHSQPSGYWYRLPHVLSSESSTALRAALARGETTIPGLDATVLNLINARQLYRAGAPSPS